jgi:Domain of unknown function (DUF4276)
VGRPALILEGPGDGAAVPRLIRAVCERHRIHEFWPLPNPIIRQNVPKLSRVGELERYVQHALRRDGDSVLVALDTDESCPKEVIKAWAGRLTELHPRKHIGVCLFRCEFESLFLCCLDRIAERFPDYGWDFDDWSVDDDHESVVGAKGALSRRMRKGRAYKETRDQVRFVSALDLERLAASSRSFQHFEATVLWLARSEGNNLHPAALGVEGRKRT